MQINTLPISLKNQKILLIGGGNVATQKAKVLHQNEIEFKIITKEILNKKIKEYSSNIEIKNFKSKDIEDYYIVIDASNCEKVTKKLLKYKKRKNLLLNVVDKPKYCDFYFMAMTKNSPLKIAVSSSGFSPTTAQYFRDECQKLIPNNIKEFMLKKYSDRANGIIDIEQTKKELQSKVYLVGCGVGDVELLTIKAYKIIQNVDVVLYDHLISQEIMDIVPKKTKKVFVGKQKDFHSKSQEEINELILKYAKKGKSVARLKSGDPFVFGRGAEELKYLLKHNILTEVVTGISSSISAPLLANIPITARDYASSFSVVSAHLKGNSVNLDWVDMLNKKNHTTVVLMGLSRVREIAEEAKRLNVDKNLSCAIISNASRKNQSVITTSLENLVEKSVDALRPAIIVFGDVVNYFKG
jgi:uroporphyrin-III C-methyltransferase/precorrin-2 dehydrogenase/sirohydrochlorin ferrochelatase